MDFAMLPPEINSSRMYTGPGSGPMVAAAAAWHTLAAELHSTANSYQSLITGLIAGPWLGPASASMAAGAAPYAAWISVTATQAEQTATQTQAAAAAYDAAFAATVPPPVIAANRSQLMTLVATNILGQNTPAIAATETEYTEMWAQDAAAMFGYASSSASATTLTPFTPPPQSTNPGGPATQAAAVSQATGTSAGNVQAMVSSVPQTFSAVPNALQSLATAAPAAAADPPGALNTLADLVTLFLDAPGSVATLLIDTPIAPLGAVALPFDVAGALTGFHTDEIVSGWAGIQAWPGNAPVPPTTFPVITNLGSSVSASSMSAGLGQANTVGALSVPPTWTTATPAVRQVALALPATSVSAAATGALEVGSGSTFSEMALAGMAGRAMAGTLGSGSGRDGRKTTTGQRVTSTGERTTTNPESPAAADKGAAHTAPPTAVMVAAAALRELARLRNEGILTDDEFTASKKRFLGQ